MPLDRRLHPPDFREIDSKPDDQNASGSAGTLAGVFAIRWLAFPRRSPRVIHRAFSSRSATRRFLIPTRLRLY
jgi:hypothetical protein